MFSKNFMWEKIGLIYKPDGKIPWSQSHAQVPVPDFRREENIIRVYISTRDSQGRSLPGYVDLDADNPLKIRTIGKTPLLELGQSGAFDDCGIMPSSILNKGKEKWLYYVGWNVHNTIPYHNSVGLSISRDGGETFQRFSKGPLWDRDWKEPYFSATPCVLSDNKIFKIWYLSCTEWRTLKGKLEPRYNIKYAESQDGINWIRNGVVAINYLSDDEAGISKPSVIKYAGRYFMWFSYRNFENYRTDIANSYRIGFAESCDGFKWMRKDKRSGIDISEDGWDSDMIEYSHVIKVKERYLMFYNGNGFGRSGFGCAILNN